MTGKQKRELLFDCMFESERGEFDGIIINDKQSLSDIPKNFRGLVLEVNDHGNMSLFRAFKNGSLHYIDSVV